MKTRNTKLDITFILLSSVIILVDLTNPISY